MSLSSRKMIFITGASRSGTTLLSFVLRNHSLIFGLKELQYFGQYWDPRDATRSLDDRQMQTAVAWMLARQAQGILAAKLTPSDLNMARELLDSMPTEDRTPAGLFAAVAHRISSAAGKPIPCEQTPRNIFYAEALLRAYPAAHVVHMLRDPRAVMASQRQRWHRRRLAADKSAVPLVESLRVWVNYHPYTVAKLWSRATHEAHRLSGHPRFTLVRFEDLVGSPEQTIRRLCDRLDIAYEPAMLDVRHINSSHQSAVGGARRGLNREAIDQWRSSLPAREAAIAERICGDLMGQDGYELNTVKNRRVDRELRYALTYPLHVAGVLAVNPRRAWIQLQAAFKNILDSSREAGSAQGRGN